jgi:hypothetical protein
MCNDDDDNKKEAAEKISRKNMGKWCVHALSSRLVIKNKI